MLFFRHIIFDYSERCNIMCEHCASECGPFKKNKLSKYQVIKSLGILPSISISKFILTGGEPFLFLPEIEEICRYAKDLNLNFEIGTNGFWATSLLKTYTLVEKFKNLGLTRFLLSADKYHQQYINIQNILNIAKISHEMGVDVKITVNMTKNDKDSKRIVEVLMKELEGFDCWITIKEPKMVGRAKKNVRRTDLTLYPIHHPSISSPCDLVYYPCVRPDGAVVTCCSMASSIVGEDSPLYLGNINKTCLDEILSKAKNNIFLHLLSRSGPFAFKMKLDEVAENYKIRRMYHVRCELCS